VEFPTNGNHEDLEESGYEPAINRMAVVIRPRQPFLDWANDLEGDIEFGEEDFREDCTTLLIPVFEYNEEARSYVHERYEEIFEHELAAISTDPDEWPEEPSLAMFLDWFDVEIHSIVIDMCDEPITDEEDEE
jgi:hypothetical protein